MSELEKMKSCSKCYKVKDMSCFICKRGRERKNCDRCRKIRKKSSNKNKCLHNKIKYGCRECKGGGICKHNIRKYRCKECKGGGVCEHNKVRSICKKCKGSSICQHNICRALCKECKGSQICEHNKHRFYCVECEGKGTCSHKKQKNKCKICDPKGHLMSNVRDRIYKALKAKKSKRSIEYLGCTIEEYKKHIEEQFTEGMTWDNYGEWHIDHIIPLKYENPSIEEVIERLHYKNTQPLWAEENIAKGNRYIG